MTFPASTQTLDDGLRTALRRAAALKSYCQAANNAMAAGPVSGNAIIDLLQSLKTALDDWAAAKAIPGMQAYAQAEFDDVGLDITAEFTAMETQAQAARDWIVANFPTSAGGFIEKDTLNADGSITVQAFTSGQTAGLQTALAGLIATIG